MSPIPEPSKLDSQQILPRAFDEATGKLRVDASVSTSISEVVISDADDSILIVGTETGAAGGAHHVLKVDTTGRPKILVESSVLPTGASTETKQDAGNSSLASIKINTDSLDVDLSTRASETTLSSINTKLTDGTQKSRILDGSGTAITSTLNSGKQGLDVNVINNPSLDLLGRNSVALIRNDYSIINVTTGAYVELLSSTPDDIHQLDIFDSSGRTLTLAIGPSGFESNKINIYPGGNSKVDLYIPSGSRISVKAISATANTGELNINCLSNITSTAGLGHNSIAILRNDYTVINVTTGAYVQLIASTSADINQIDIFDSSGSTLALAIGASGFEVNKLIIYPGGNGEVKLKLPSGSRLSIKALNTTANRGELDINCLS